MAPRDLKFTTEFTMVAVKKPRRRPIFLMAEETEALKKIIKDAESHNDGLINAATAAIVATVAIFVGMVSFVTIPWVVLLVNVTAFGALAAGYYGDLRPKIYKNVEIIATAEAKLAKDEAAQSYWKLCQSLMKLDLLNNLRKDRANIEARIASRTTAQASAKKEMFLPTRTVPKDIKRKIRVFTGEVSASPKKRFKAASTLTRGMRRGAPWAPDVTSHMFNRMLVINRAAPK